MKIVLAIVVAIVIVLLAINYITTGKLSIMPPGSGGSDEGQVNRLRGEFREVARDYRQAQKQAAMAGLDTTDAAAAALADLNRVEREVSDLAANAGTEEVRTEARTLLAEIRQYKRDIQ